MYSQSARVHVNYLNHEPLFTFRATLIIQHLFLHVSASTGHLQGYHLQRDLADSVKDALI